MYIYIYIQMYMWQMSSVFSHESAQRNDAGHLIDKNVFKTTRSFCYQWFHVSTLQANANRPFILSSMKRTTGGGHLEKCIFKMAAASSALHAWQYEWSISICLKSGNMKPLVAKWPCCFKDIFIYIYIHVSGDIFCHDYTISNLPRPYIS